MVRFQQLGSIVLPHSFPSPEDVMIAAGIPSVKFHQDLFGNRNRRIVSHHDVRNSNLSPPPTFFSEEYEIMENLESTTAPNTPNVSDDEIETHQDETKDGNDEVKTQKTSESISGGVPKTPPTIADEILDFSSSDSESSKKEVLFKGSISYKFCFHL